MQSIEIKVNDAADRRTLAGILVDADCSVKVERRTVQSLRRKTTDTWIIITKDGGGDGTVEQVKK